MCDRLCCFSYSQRDIPIPLITDDIVEKFVELNDGMCYVNNFGTYVI